MKTDSIRVRLNSNEKQDIESLAIDYGLTSSDVVRLAMTAFIREVKRNNGHVILPCEIRFLKTEIPIKELADAIEKGATKPLLKKKIG